MSFLVAMLIAACATASSGARPLAGASIVYERGGDLYAVSLDGARTTRLTRSRIEELDPRASRDGRIAFARGQVLAGEIWTMNGDGSHAHRVTHGPDGSPTWSADGRWIYFVRYFPGGHSDTCGSIFRVHPNGSALRRVTIAGLHSHENPSVSPDGTRIVYDDWNGCSGGTTDPRLAVADTAGRPTAELGRLPRNGHYPDPEHAGGTWSPDGSRIAFLLDGRVSVANRDGSGVRVLSHLGASEPPAWSPDGTWLVFENDDLPTYGDLYLVRLDGTGLHRLTHTRSRHRSPSFLAG